MPRTLKPTKHCPGCDKDLPRSEFYPRGDGTRSVQTYCKSCEKDRVNQAQVARMKVDPEFKARRYANRDRWRKKNPDKMKAGCARYRERHRDEINRRARKKRAELRRTNQLWEQLPLPFEPMHRAVLENGVPIIVLLDQAEQRMYHRYQQEGWAPAWFVDEILSGKLRRPEALEVLYGEAV